MFGLEINKEVTVRLTIVCDGNKIVLPASSLEHAKLLADTIADSMLLYDDVGYNYHYIENFDGNEWVEWTDDDGDQSDDSQ